MEVRNGFDHLAIQVDVLAATLNALTQAGLKPESVQFPGGSDGPKTAWLTDPDPPGSWEADYEVLAIDGDACVAHGRTRYLTDDRAAIDREFANVFVTHFDDEGRCREFTEWYMRKRPDVLPDE